MRLLVPALLPLLAAPALADGSQASCTLSVSARVVPYVRLESLQQGAALEVSEAAIARGYVEVRAGARLSVRTNSREGYLVNLDLEPGVIRRVEVLGLPREAALESGRARILRVPAEIPRESFDLGFRFHLAPDARPGSYPWPLGISLSILEAGPSAP